MRRGEKGGEVNEEQREERGEEERRERDEEWELKTLFSRYLSNP